MKKRDVFGALVAVGLLVAACSSDSSESTSEDDPTVQDAVFSFEDDDLCEWISEDTLTGFVAGEFDWDGVAVQVTPSSGQTADEPRGRLACHWELTESSGGYVTIYAPTTLDVGFGLENYDDVAGFIVDQPVLGHPALSEGVAYFQGGSADLRSGFQLPTPTSFWARKCLVCPRVRILKPRRLSGRAGSSSRTRSLPNSAGRRRPDRSPIPLTSQLRRVPSF